MLELELSVGVLLALIFAAFVAGYLDTLVGGGGLITIPALLMAGVPPLMTLGTNKLQAVAGSGTASLMMLRLGKVSFRQVRWLMLAAFVGSLIGTLLVQTFSAEVLELVIPVVIVVIAVYFLFSPNSAFVSRQPRITEKTYAATAVPAVGFYDGMFGPGTGSFFVLAGVSLRGEQIVDATARAKTMNFATNLASLIVFLVFGQFLLLVGLGMMVGQALGARLGAHTLVRINPRYLRLLVIGMCLIMLASWGLQSL